MASFQVYTSNIIYDFGTLSAATAYFASVRSGVLFMLTPHSTRCWSGHYVSRQTLEEKG